MQYKDYYKILEVPRTATQEDIKRSYKKLARKYHPDVSKEKNAEQLFKELGEAYAVLKDPKKRAAYDQLGSNWQEGQGFTPPPDWQTQFSFDGSDIFGGQSGGFSDFFETLFGGMRTGQGGKSSGFYQRSMNEKGADQHASIEISLEDVFNGTVKTIALQTPEFDNSGNYTLNSHTLNVKIPKGIGDGQNIRLAGQGGSGVGNAPRGDLYLNVKYHPHPLFRVEQRNLYLTVPITPWEAALGTSIEVPTLDKKLTVKIPPNSQAKQKLRLKGQGLPGKEPGDLYVVLEIVTPPATTEEARDLYRKMAAIMPMNPRTHL
jgi:curved DNA-binding protein